MFTGLVDDVGTIERVTTTDAGIELRIRSRYHDVAVGESIAVNGVCLTARESASGWFSVAAVETTAAVTTIGEWRAGRRVNLERALRPTDRMGGHFVQGHVDGVGRVVRSELDGDALMLEVVLPPGLSDLVVDRGSIAIDGVSLTVAGLPTTDTVHLSIIDHTRRHTTLGALRSGDAVHVEADVLAKHVKKLLEGRMTV